MLAGTSLWLAQNGYHVSIVGRTEKKMKSLLLQTENITPLYLDYQDESEFRHGIQHSIKQNGPIQLVVAWIHRVTGNPVRVMMDELSHQINDWDLYHVLGSNSNIEEIRRGINTPKGCRYHQVQLGFVIENDVSRLNTRKMFMSLDNLNPGISTHKGGFYEK
ncbi:short-chain dehydrogenase [Tenuibacillus multivorans]|nr:short-chain dehydrogenase [Tenuibacillus multivorans]